jgi:hypothetical protein
MAEVLNKAYKEDKTLCERPAFDRSCKYLGKLCDDYVFVENEKNKDCIGIKGGKYDGVVYKYGKTAAVEDASNPGLQAVLKFNYNIVDPNGLPDEYFDVEFKNLLGDILCHIVDSHFSRGEIFNADEPDNRTDDSKSTIT